MMTSTSVNFTAQRISFVNKIGLILKATSDDEQPTQAFLYKEINDISYESVGYSESLVEFLLDRLKNRSCHVRFKVLKIVKHLCTHGSSDVKLGLRKASDMIKECTKFSGPPHPLHGNVPYAIVRKLAKEVCEDLYNMDLQVLKANQHQQERPPESKYGGLGTSRSGGSIQGFGNTPAVQPKGLGETILGGIEKLGAKMSETTQERQAAVLARLELSASTSNYQPPIVNYQTPESTPSPPTEQAATENVPTQSPPKKHEPGKAGGGWNDDEDDEETEIQSSHKLSVDTDSLADTTHKLNQNDLQPDWSQESEIVDLCLQRGSTGAYLAFLSPSDLKVFQEKCTLLSSHRIVEMISQRLSTKDPGEIIRGLQLLEGFIYNKEELMNIDLLTSLCQQDLVNCYRNCAGISSTSNTTMDNTSDCEGQGQHLWQAAKVKVVKIILILQQLSSYREILPTSEFIDFLPKRQNVVESPA